MIRYLAFALLALFATIGAAYAQTAKLVQQYNDWSTFVHEAGGGKTCFAASAPLEQEPKNVNRGDIFFYITTWAGQNVSEEVSIKIGYTFKADAPVTVEIGSDKFQLFAKDDKAFVASSEVEKRLVAAMRRGSELTVKGLSARGTLTTDRYSLRGISAALSRATQECK